MNRVVGRSGILLILVLLLTAGSVFFVGDYLLNSGDWVMETGSPHVYTDYSSVSGVVTDRAGFLLMDTTDGRVYTENEMLRKSIIHWLGDRQGNIHTPMIGHYAAQLTGHDPVNGLYVYGNEGGRITLTLSARVQMAALQAMGDQKGVVAVYNYKSGEILCAVTTPTYDPDDLPDIAGDTTGAYEGAYMNRFVKSAYIPGSIFKIVTAAAALETIPDIQEQTFLCEGVRVYGSGEKQRVTCMAEHGAQTLQEAFRNSCNCAFAAIADQLGGETLDRYARQLGITDKLTFDGMTTTPGKLQTTGESDLQVAWSAIGQHRDLVNPCQFMTLVGTIAGGGTAASPYLVSSIDGGKWGSYQAGSAQISNGLSENTLLILKQLMRNNVETYYGDENFPGLTVCAKSGTAQVGGGAEDNAMFTGFVADEEYPLAFIVVVENGGFGRRTCVPILAPVLQACKEIMDSE